MSSEQIRIKTDSLLQKQAAVTQKPVESQSPHSPLVNLQRSLGNYAYGRMIQAKLKIGEPGDIYEQEADRVADQVMRMPDPMVSGDTGDEEDFVHAKPVGEQITPIIQRQYEHEDDMEEEEALQMKPSTEQITPVIQRQYEPEEEEEELLQAKPVGQGADEISPDIASSIESMKGGGQPLSQAERNFFEPRFGYDFSRVRVHTNKRAAETARSLNARAYTTGTDIVFGRGENTTDSFDGRKLLAHELTHVLHQNNGTQAGLKISRDRENLLHRSSLTSNEESSSNSNRPSELDIAKTRCISELTKLSNFLLSSASSMHQILKAHEHGVSNFQTYTGNSDPEDLTFAELFGIALSFIPAAGPVARWAGSSVIRDVTESAVQLGTTYASQTQESREEYDRAGFSTGARKQIITTADELGRNIADNLDIYTDRIQDAFEDGDIEGLRALRGEIKEDNRVARSVKSDVYIEISRRFELELYISYYQPYLWIQRTDVRDTYSFMSGTRGGAVPRDVQHRVREILEVSNWREVVDMDIILNLEVIEDDLRSNPLLMLPMGG